MRSVRTRVQAFGVALLVTVSAGGVVSCAATSRTERTGALVWHECGEIECATLSVPLDWTHPKGRRIHLALARRPAEGKERGVLLANPGGPGGSGVEFLREGDRVFSQSVRDHFDIVSWDPRGVGASTAVDCTDDLDFFYSVDRTNVEASTVRDNVAVAKRFVDACRRNSRGLLPFLSTRASVADMDAIRAAMGVGTISYLGFSYGTYLGALYADRYPTRVRTMVLDGAVDPTRSFADGTISQAVGFDRSLDAFLEWCRHNSHCHFAPGGNPITAFRDLNGSLAHETLPAELNGEERTLTPGEANIGIATALYAGRGREGWETLGKALSDAAQGKGSGLLSLSDLYTGRETGGRYSDLTDAFYAIGCLDAPAPPTVAAVTRVAERAERAAPVFGASTVWLGLPCTFWPAKPDGKVGPIHAAGAPPILVIGTTDDPATPYESAQALSRELASARLLTWVGEGHTAYGRADACINDRVDAYLISRQLPREGTRCE